MKEEKHLVFYNISKYVLGFIFLMYYRPKMINKNAIPKDGPIIICGNHMHLFDQNLACLSTKRMIHYMAKKEYFDNKKISWFFRLVGCISVNRGMHDEFAKKEAISILNNGYALGIFPEGTRNKTEKFLLPFKYGAVSLAQKTGASIVPFAITGKYRFLKNHLNIRFGSPFKVSKDANLSDANNRLFNEIKHLKEAGINDIKEGVL